MIDNMKITSAKYVSIEGSVSTILATIDGVKWQVPLSTDNRHYRAIQEWVAAGNKIEDAD
tara:strand:- start:61 stop:240 length:180 start_codon:yes stop_codon:yes gene_type:complete